MKHRIFITGDTHCPHDIHKLNKENFPVSNLTKDDYVIICGDGGFVWSGDRRDKIWQQWIDKQPFTTIYVDGNHENHDLLNSYPVVDFFGAEAHQISESLYHIKRGEIFKLNDKTFFCFGGAFSHDREYRVEGYSWWQNELPVQQEIDNALDHLKEYHNKVDYIITHDVPLYVNHFLGYNKPNMNNYDAGYIHICSFLQNIYETVEFDCWFAGHYHINREISNIQILYNEIVELNDDGYSFLKNHIQEIYDMNFSEEDLKKIIVQYNLMFTGRSLCLKKDIEEGSTYMRAIDYFDKPLSNNELSMFNKMLKIFLIQKSTIEDM